MADSSNKALTDSKRVLNRHLIAVDDEVDLRAWTQRLQCTRDELRKAVEAAGNVAALVEEYLRRQRVREGLNLRASGGEGR